jgi:hypothetical protein
MLALVLNYSSMVSHPPTSVSMRLFGELMIAVGLRDTWYPTLVSCIALLQEV